MSNLNTEDFFTPPDTRLFLEKGPTRPGASFEYLGTAELMASEVKNGATTPVRIQSRSQRRKWVTAGTKQAPPDLHTTGVHAVMPRLVQSFVEEQAITGCVVNFQLVEGKCNKPDEFLTGWESKLLFEAAHLDGFKLPEMPSVDGSKIDEVYVDGTMTFEFYGRILSMLFGEKAGATIVAEEVDGVYAGPPSCGDCGPYSDGNDHLYTVTKANPGSPGLSGQLVYTNDGATFTAVDIPTLGGLSPNAITEVGDFLIVVSEAKRNLQYCRRKTTIAATDWVSVTTGFVAAHGPRAVFAKNPGEVFFAGAGGYIYKATNYQSYVSPVESGTLTSENYNKIHGDGGDVLVAVGDNNTVVYSVNNGQTWALLTGPLPGSDLQALAVMDAYNWVVGGDGGAFYYTNDQGANWVAIPFSLQGVGAIITDVEFCPMSNQVGFMSVEVGGRGYIFRTTDGGTHWFNDEPSVRGVPAAARYNYVATSPNSLNVCAAGGLQTVGTDGILVVGR